MSLLTESREGPAIKSETEKSSNYLNSTAGWRTWLGTLDHKRIGIMYFWTIMVFFLVGGVLALLVRLELLYPEPTIMAAGTYNQVFTLHGAIMVFLFLIPAAPTVLGNFFLPLQIGAQDVAFPRLNLASYYILVTGAVIMVSSILVGGLDTGWTFYMPYAAQSGTAVTSMVLGRRCSPSRFSCWRWSGFS